MKKHSPLLTIVEIAGIIASMIWGNELILVLFMAAMIVVCVTACIVEQIKGPQTGKWKSTASTFVIFAILTIVGFIAVRDYAIPAVKAFEAENEITGPMRVFAESSEATIYWDEDTLTFYTVYEDENGKHFEKAPSHVSTNSDLKLFHNHGYEFPPPFSHISHFYIYTSNNNSISGNEYIFSYDYEHKNYVARVVVPGVIDFHESLANATIKIKTPDSSNEENLQIENSDEFAWNPGDWKLTSMASLVLLEGPIGTFDAVSYEVPFKSNELFHVRLNEYYRGLGDEKTNVTDQMIQPVKTLDVTSGLIQQVSFYKVGTKNGKSFDMKYMAVEIVYSSGRSKIAVIREIPAEDFLTAIDIS